MQENRRSENVKQIIGELLAISPILIVSFFINLFAQALLSVVLIFTFKRFYKNGCHIPKGKSYICIFITYFTMSFALSVAYKFKGEYFTQIVFVSVVCFINALTGEWQENSNKFILIKEPYIKLRNAEIKRQSFNVDTCTETELRERCNLKGFSFSKTEKAVQHFIYKIEHKILDPIRPETSENERYRMKKELTE